MKAFLRPSQEALLNAHLDITQPDAPVELRVDDRGVVWVNVGGVCVLRICRNTDVTVNVNGEDVHKWSK